MTYGLCSSVTTTSMARVSSRGRAERPSRSVLAGLLSKAHRRGHALRAAARHQPDVLALGLEADVVGAVGLRWYAEQGGIHLLSRHLGQAPSRCSPNSDIHVGRKDQR
jgi:hypothetical protein